MPDKVTVARRVGENQAKTGSARTSRARMDLQLKFACGEYDRTIPFRTGDVKPRGIALDYTPQPPELTFLQQLQDMRYDVSEMSMSAYTQLRADGRDDFVALPVFPSRVFRHSALYVRTDSAISRPEHLRGKRVGIGYYQMSGAVWVRGFLLDDYGIKPSDIEWVSGMDVKAQPGADQVDQLQDMVDGTRRSKPKLELMLEDGEIDALVSVHTPRAMQRNEGRVRYLFRNCREIEEDYFRRTGIFPMMHTIVIKRGLYDRHPWIAQSLFDAFSEAKRRAMDQIYETNALTVAAPFIVHDIERTRALMGTDYWPFGIYANRNAIATFLRHLKAQEIINRVPEISELFIDVKVAA
jgi:4,5-dihydroxyphthalate decarboxylase